MKIYFASTDSTKMLDGRSCRMILAEEGIPHTLFSFAHDSKANRDGWEQVWRAASCHVIIDSGAFTAFTTGKQFSCEEYAGWALALRERWQAHMASLVFMNLDVIGDQDATWKNHERLRELGLETLPIVTFGADKKHLERALEHPYMALGGLVPYTRQRGKLQAWLDACFHHVMAHKKHTGVMPKMHLLGVTQQWALERYPCYSSDSSSWQAVLRFGGGAKAGIDKLPGTSHGQSAVAAALHALRSEVRHYKHLQNNVTRLWERRGIYWDDNETVRG